MSVRSLPRVRGDAERTRAVNELRFAFGSGFVFGVGLLLAGMTRPAKVVAFLDVLGAWDPALALVMAGAVAVYALGVRWARRARQSADGAPSSSTAAARIDRPLLLGSAIFGVGWGLCGYCPGPSLVALGSGALSALLFVGFMLIGNFGGALFLRRSRRPAGASHDDVVAPARRRAERPRVELPAAGSP
jgi:uncharacterized membrane protein YedE/YeeE